LSGDIFSLSSFPETLSMLSVADTKTCLACGKPLKGRIDKKFCDDYCRNNYNNQQKSKAGHSNFVRNINNALLKNRKILESLLTDSEETAKANKDKLLRLGFQFKYLTHIYTTRTGKTYYYCYEYGYLPLDHDWYLIVKKKEE
jgi:predicted nucleic acid-binding Zn ribbon protein